MSYQKLEILPQTEELRMVDALKAIRHQIRWKSGKDTAHVEKRRKMQHIQASASMSDYEKMIADIVKNEQNTIYLYDFDGIHYYGVRGFVRDVEWLVIFGSGGVMETAFPPRDIDNYLYRRGFVRVGIIEEVLKWTREAVN